MNNSSSDRTNQIEGSNKEPRSVRRKREIRARLLKAAFELMSDRNKDEVTVSEITEAADIGFGTFYNYFESKDAIFNALLSEVIERSAMLVDETAKDLPDAAERLSVGVRNTILQAQSDPIWGGFLMRTPLDTHFLSIGLGKFLKRDLEQGVASNRFQIDDMELALLAISSTVLGILSVEMNRLRADLENKTEPYLQASFRDGVAENTAAIVLRIVGVRDAAAVANRPLPPLHGCLNIFS